MNIRSVHRKYVHHQLPHRTRFNNRAKETRRTRFLGALDDEVVDHHTDVAVCAREHERRPVLRGEPGVDARDDALRGGFFVARRTCVRYTLISVTRHRRRGMDVGRTVDLAGEEQALGRTFKVSVVSACSEGWREE